MPVGEILKEVKDQYISQTKPVPQALPVWRGHRFKGLMREQRRSMDENKRLEKYLSAIAKSDKKLKNIS